MTSAKIRKDERVVPMRYAPARGAKVDWLQRERINAANEQDEDDALDAWCESLKGGG